MACGIKGESPEWNRGKNHSQLRTKCSDTCKHIDRCRSDVKTHTPGGEKKQATELS